ncbi:hypothetical protein, partial [Paenibacillus thiaminolyticus]
GFSNVLFYCTTFFNMFAMPQPPALSPSHGTRPILWRKRKGWPLKGVNRNWKVILFTKLGIQSYHFLIQPRLRIVSLQQIASVVLLLWIGSILFPTLFALVLRRAAMIVVAHIAQLEVVAGYVIGMLMNVECFEGSHRSHSFFFMVLL